MSKVVVRLPSKTVLIDTKATIEIGDFFVSELHTDGMIPKVHQYEDPQYDPNDISDHGYYKILASTEFIDETIDLLVL